MKSRTKVLIVVGVVTVLVPLLLVRVLIRLGSQEAKPRFTQADLTPLPGEATNLFVSLMREAKKTPRCEFDRSVFDAKSWDELKERRENGLNLDFQREAWAQAEVLDGLLKPTGTFVETCELGEPCQLMPVLRATEVLMARVLVLTNRGELDDAESLVFRLRALFIDWEKSPRTLLGMVMAHSLAREVEKLMNLLAVDGSPMRERIMKRRELCELLVMTKHRDPIIFEAASFHAMAADVGKGEALFWVFDHRESQEMVDRCAEAVLANPDAACSFAGLDGWPDWAHNKEGRSLAGGINMAMMNVMNRQRRDEGELADVQRRAWCAGK